MAAADPLAHPLGPRLTPQRLAIIVSAIAVYWWAARGTEMSPAEFVAGLPAIGNLLAQMFPPDWSYLLRLGPPLIETLQIGIVSTVVAGIIALPLGFLAARNTSPHWLIYMPIRVLLTVFRGVAEIIWALFFVVAVGLGPFAGVIALVIFCVGMIGKLLAEAVEAVDPGPLEAMASVGAPRWKVFLYGAWPQVLPLYLSYCLYYWDHNTRQAAVLGFVGGGGLGYSLFYAISSYEFERATAAIILMIALIIVIDRFCLFLRRKII